ncbi:hypothetical protein F1559_003744 [Cyanidiococcus yangmingshanensis]|uniref:Iron export ABC transporter permease subunit FetB n=1 Tax=Cyanidiococcus yangmingshanensis TaxID=2690220 RepID=A0A7J7IKZ7_9RHOD|nr:hypothetical protein F1559_003744 [Cyanidiococcus yangmingshanensis]
METNMASSAGALPIDLSQLTIAYFFVILSVLAIWFFGVGIEVDLVWASLRAAVQLLLVGLVLRWIFDANLALLVFLAVGVMMLVASWTAAQRTSHPLPGMFLSVLVSLLMGAGFIIVEMTWIIIRVKPFWMPRYFIPLSGMILGNAMNTVALLGERMQSEVASHEKHIEELLCMGASPSQAIGPALRASLRSALIPVVNTMLTVGLVSLPGMMTGQIVGNGSTDVAARYQIVIFYMITAGSTLSGCMLALLMSGKFFDQNAWRLKRHTFAGRNP